MRLGLDPQLAESYKSGAQRARRLTEGWFASEMYCAACGAVALRPYPNNTRASDFHCESCGASFELKSGRMPFGAVVPDGAFSTMMERLERRGGGPHLALLRYDLDSLEVRDLTVVPASFLTKDIIIRRRPLASHAQRAGWVGCNIRLADVPAAGRIAVVRGGIVLPRNQVVQGMRNATAIRGGLAARTWLVDTLRCIERLGEEFSLEELYAFDFEFQRRYPSNRNVRPKLRQQLQKLRDAGLLAFLGNARYRRITV